MQSSRLPLCAKPEAAPDPSLSLGCPHQLPTSFPSFSLCSQSNPIQLAWLCGVAMRDGLPTGTQPVDWWWPADCPSSWQCWLFIYSTSQLHLVTWQPMVQFTRQNLLHFWALFWPISPCGFLHWHSRSLCPGLI